VRGWGQRGEMTQALYAHMNNNKKKADAKKKKRKTIQQKNKLKIQSSQRR
jgi:hypothetical protein